MRRARETVEKEKLSRLYEGMDVSNFFTSESQAPKIVPQIICIRTEQNISIPLVKPLLLYIRFSRPLCSKSGEKEPQVR